MTRTRMREAAAASWSGAYILRPSRPTAMSTHMPSRILRTAITAAMAVTTVAQAQSRGLPADSILVRGLSFRSIGPALMGGRITDIAVADAAKPGKARIGT